MSVIDRFRSVCALTVALAPVAAQTFTPVATAATALQLSAHGSAGTTVPAGTPLPAGFVARDNGTGGATATFAIGIVNDLATPRVTFTVADTYSFGLGVGTVPLYCSTGPHDTVLSIASSVPVDVGVNVRWSHGTTGAGAGAAVDVGDDGSFEWQGYQDQSTLPTTLMATIGATPLRIRTRTLTAGSLDPLFQRHTGTGPSSLVIEVRPRTVELALVSGGEQSTAAGDPFLQPVVVAVRNAAGLPLAAAPVTLAFSGPASSTVGPVVLTDQNGLATIPIVSSAYSQLDPGAGNATMAVTTPGVATAVATRFYVDELGIGLTSGAAGVLALNPGPMLGPVPYVLLCSLPGIPPLQSVIGPIATNPFDPTTVVLEDSIGFFGFPTLSGIGAQGQPSWFQTYNLPAGFLAGITLQFQAVGLHQSRGLFRTNATNVTF